MKQITALVFILFVATSTTFSQKAIFLHHSTGAGVWGEGNVESWISNYNTNHGTSFSVSERSYPNSPYPWENYPYDYWNLWVNGSCNSDQPGIECMNTLTQNYNLIIFKHCFPGAGIEADLGSPNVTSNRKSLENYKAQYRALRSMMDRYPDNRFMVWTLAPLHRNATTVEDAARAKQFVDWVKSTWLIEDGHSHPNIYLFDFFGIVAESNPHPSSGKVNCLQYDFEGDHNGSDSHPNYAANQFAGPQFAEAIVNCLGSISAIPVESIEISTESGHNTISVNGGNLQLQATVLPDNASNKSITWSIIDGGEFADISSDGELHALHNGTVRVQAAASDGSGITNTIDITITHQPIFIESLEIRSVEGTNHISTDNGTLHLFVFSLPEAVTYTNVTWSVVSGSSQISISESGVVTALSNGTAQVMTIDNNGSGIHDLFDIVVSNQFIPVQSIEISTYDDIRTIDTEGGSIQLHANILPDNATHKNITWSIFEGEEFAEISPDGLLHAIRNGTVRVQAAANDGSWITNSIDITISNQPIFVESLEIRSEENTFMINADNGTLHLYGFTMPEAVRYDSVIWSVVSGSDKVSISESGVVTALSDGIAQIMVVDKGISGIHTVIDIFVSNQINPIESIEIKSAGNVTTISTLGGSLQLMAHVLPANFTGYIVWSITDGNELAYITPDGLLTAHRNGKVQVQASASDNPGVNASKEITITNQPVFLGSLEIRSEEITNIINTDNGTLHLYGYTMPEAVRYDSVIWSVVSGSDKVSISGSGVVTALSDGIAQVMATDKAHSGIYAIVDVFVSNQINPIESIEIKTAGNGTTISTQGGSLQLTAQVLPANFTGHIVWSITDGNELAYITPDGLLIAHRNGKVRVHASASDNPEVNASKEITITNQPIFLGSFEIRSEEITNIINSDNGTLHLFGYTMPEAVRYDNVTWSVISGSDKVSISESGVVTALTDGIAQVMATDKAHSGIYAIFDVFVSNQINPIESIEISTAGNVSTISTLGGSLKLTAHVLPVNFTGYIVWSIIDGNELAEITPDGLLIAHRNGRVRVQASAIENPAVKSFIDITITSQPIFVESIEVRSEEGTNLINIDNGSLHLYAWSLPEKVNYDDISWSIPYGNEVISVSNTGVVTAISNGMARVMATANICCGDITDLFEINVSNQLVPIDSIEITTNGHKKTIDTYRGELQLIANLMPGYATSYVIWSIVSGNDCGTILGNGLLGATNNGIVVVQAASSDNPAVSDTISITITHQFTSVDQLRTSDIKVTFDKRNGSFEVCLGNDNSVARLQLYSMSGQLIWSGKGSVNTYTIPKQKPGVYLLNVLKDNRRYAEKLVY